MLKVQNNSFMFNVPRQEIGIKEKPLINIGRDNLPYFQVVLCDSLPQVIKDQLLEGLYVDLFPVEHLSPICGFLSFNDHTYGTFCFVPVLDYEVVAGLGIDEMIGMIIGSLEEIYEEFFVDLLALGLVASNR